jgi:hypothetical protein
LRTAHEDVVDLRRIDLRPGHDRLHEIGDRSSGRTPDSAPPNLPMGVRALADATSGMATQAARSRAAALGINAGRLLTP